MMFTKFTETGYNLASSRDFPIIIWEVLEDGHEMWQKHATNSNHSITRKIKKSRVDMGVKNVHWQNYKSILNT